jgi:hypothetical protein
MAIRFMTTSCNGAQHIRGDGNRVIGSGGWSGLQARALDRRLCKLKLGVEKRVAGNVAGARRSAQVWALAEVAGDVF